MARPKKSSVLDFRILFLAVFILACLAAIGVRLWFVQVKWPIIIEAEFRAAPKSRFAFHRSG